MKITVKLTLASIFYLIVTPFVTEASGATLLNDRTSLFTIDFEFTDDLYQVEVPLLATYGVTHLDRVDTLGYTLENNAGEMMTPDLVTALVLSRAPLQASNRYGISIGETGSFTLFILATYRDPIDETITARITKLPYWFDERRTTVHQNQLDTLETPSLVIAK